MTEDEPIVLDDRDIWVIWNEEKRNPDDEKPTKIPYNPHTGHKGDSTDPSTWASYEKAVEAAEEYDADGIGYAFPGDFTGIDLDDVVEEGTGEIEDWAEEIIEDVDSYTEFSTSGTGVHITALGTKPGDSCRTDIGDSDIEVYDEDRFFVYTGDHYPKTPKEPKEREDEIAEVYQFAFGDDDEEPSSAPRETTLEDEEIIEKAKNAENGEAFTRLWEGDTSGYPSQSEADLALCGHLAFYSGGDRQQIDRLFRQSGLYRDKWDRDDYRSRTIDKALEGRTEFYEPQGQSSKAIPSQRYTSIGEALAEEPDEWIDADAKKITVHELPNTDHELNDIQEFFSDLDASDVFSLTDDVDEDTAEVLVDLVMSSEEWEITTARHSDGWKNVYGQFEHDDIPKNQAIHAATEQLRKEESFATVRETDELHIYREGVFHPRGSTYVKETLERHLGRNYSSYVRRQVMDRLRASSYHDFDRFGADEPMVCVRNGVLDLSDLPDGEVTLLPHSPEYRFLSKVDVEYDPEAEAPEFDSFLDEVLESEEDKKTIYEMIGYTLWPRYDISNRFLILYGEGSNGKTVLLNAVKEFLGDDATTSFDLQEFEQNRWPVGYLPGARANISADLSAKKLKSSNTIKKLTGDDSLMGEKKGKDMFQFTNNAKMLFAANDPPVIDDSSYAIYRRLLPVEMTTKFTARDDEHEDKDPEMLDRITTSSECSGILNRALDGLARLLTNGDFTSAEPPEVVKARYKKISDPIADFAHRCLTNDTVEKVRKDDVHEAYNAWAADNSCQTKSQSVFHRALRQNPDVKTRQTKPTCPSEGRVRVYENMTFTDEGWDYAPTNVTFDAERRRAKREQEQEQL